MIYGESLRTTELFTFPNPNDLTVRFWVSGRSITLRTKVTFICAMFNDPNYNINYPLNTLFKLIPRC